MSNILTWDIKPIQLPKVNSNLLAVISMIVICIMAFLMVQPILAQSSYDPCEVERSSRNTALLALALASTTLSVTLLTGQWWAIGLATAALGIAIRAVNDTQAALDRCEKENGYDGDGFWDDEWIGGGCISGGCDEDYT